MNHNHANFATEAGKMVLLGAVAIQPPHVDWAYWAATLASVAVGLNALLSAVDWCRKFALARAAVAALAPVPVPVPVAPPVPRTYYPPPPPGALGCPPPMPRADVDMAGD